MARDNEYDETGRIILRDTEGTIISFYRFMELSLGPNSHPWAPPYWWGGYAGHQGYDLGAPAYSEVRSLCTGKVVVVRGIYDGDGSMGNSVCIEETGQPSGAVVRTHRYMHFAEYPPVSLGDVVEQGTLLGYVGSTGESSGNHLHYDVTRDGPWGQRLDGWDCYNHSSEPVGWTPQAITDASGSPWGTNLSWSVIGETTGINYGPGKAGGTEPAYTPKTFYTTKPVLSVDWASIKNKPFIDLSTVGGLIIQVGNLTDTSTSVVHLSEFKQWLDAYRGVLPLGFYLYSYLTPSSTTETLKNKYQIFLNALETEGITPENTSLGVWLRLGDDSPVSSSAATNLKQVTAFRELIASKGYPTTGLACSVDYITNNLNLADLAGIPLWIHAWTDTTGSSHASSATAITSYVPAALYTALEDTIYLWEDGTVSYPQGFIDHNWVMKEIPAVGYNEDIPDAGYVGGGIPELLPSPKIFFYPEPGRILTPSTELRIETNAENAGINYTIDNTEPEFIVPGASVLVLEEYKKLPSRNIGKNLFVRAWAFDADTKEVVAKGSACYAWVWTPTKAQKAPQPLVTDTELPYLYEDEG